ncbi:hypothetical protein [Acaryochloris sp. IP29b_bin.148]|uniref:hypothetical protein n=1 Tax=Acaryochloris sp. IP29b_bin.148 TaxID=2969218 RepID=UPI0026178D49|nr:hypothetical protein [Acaryochloris sp. IP29b_bin.148]
MQRTNALTHKTLAGIAALAVSFSTTAALATPVQRQIITQGPNGASKLAKVTATQPSQTRQLSPFNLAYMAYQGWFTHEGIPAASRLVRDYRVGRLTATEVAQAAVQTNRLSAEVLEDPSYLSSLDSQLQALSQSD